MSVIERHKNDITNLKTEAIVNAANTKLIYGRGVCGSVFDAAGRDALEKACSVYGHCDVGKAVITSAYGLKNNKYIIHAVGPDCRKLTKGREKLLADAYKSALELAKQHNIHSIGFPLISAGIYAYPEVEAWEIALAVCSDFITNNQDYDITIVFVRRHRSEVDLGKEVLAAIQADKRSELLRLISVNPRAVREGTAYLKDPKKIEWGGGPTGEKTEDGHEIIQWPFPIYDDKLFELLSILGIDYNYIENLEQIERENIVPSDMTAAQIRTVFTGVVQNERFCDGYIEAFVMDNTLLKLYLRLDDLLEKYNLL